MTHTLIGRAQSVVLTGAILMTLLLVAFRGPVAAVDTGGSCRVASDSGARALATPASFDLGNGCAAGTSPIGYRMP